MSTQKKGVTNVDHILNNTNDEQEFIMEKWSKLVGKVLSNIEIALPEGKQYLVLKRLLNDIIYGTRNNLLVFFNQEREKSEEIVAKISEEMNSMIEQINNKLEMTFPQNKQQQAVKASVLQSIEEVSEDIAKYFLDVEN